MRKIFTEKSGSRADLKISTMMSLKETKGEVGLEIEVEGNKFPKSGIPGFSNPVGAELIPPQWVYHKDNSLRGADNAEYVLKKPLPFKDIPEAVNQLWRMFDEYGSKLDVSNRTSVHVHLNAQSFFMNRICAFFALYFSVEELLTAWCGEHRVGNLFCLRAKDATAIISKLKRFIQTDGQDGLSDGLHYAGVNALALKKFGSIEIRALRGVTDPDTIIQWVSILERIYNLSKNFKDPREICNNFSGEGAFEYLNMVLGDKVHIIRSGVSFDDQQIMQSLYDGIRLAQDLCYCREWSDFNPVDLKPDPFRRRTKSVLAQMQEYAAVDTAFYSQYTSAMTTPSAEPSGVGLSLSDVLTSPVQPSDQLPWPDPAPMPWTGPTSIEEPDEIEEGIFYDYPDYEEEESEF